MFDRIINDTVWVHYDEGTDGDGGSTASLEIYNRKTKVLCTLEFLEDGVVSMSSRLLTPMECGEYDSIFLSKIVRRVEVKYMWCKDISGVRVMVFPRRGKVSFSTLPSPSSPFNNKGEGVT